MNNKKQIIQIVIIIAAFAGAFFVLYSNGLFGGGGASSASGSGAQASQTLEPILPYGPNLIFESAINPELFDYNQITLPKVSQTEIGQQVNSLIQPIPTPVE